MKFTICLLMLICSTLSLVGKNPIDSCAVSKMKEQVEIKTTEKNHLQTTPQKETCKDESKIVDKIVDSLISITMLLLGVLINNSILFRKENKRLKDEFLKWKYQLWYAKDIILRQTDEFNLFLTERIMASTNLTPPKLTSYIGVDGCGFNLLNINDLQKYLSNKKSKLSKEESLDIYSKIYYNIMLMKTQNQIFQEDYNLFLKKGEELNNRYEKALQKYKDELILLDYKSKILVNNYPAIKKLLKLLNEKIIDKVPNIDVFDSYKDFVSPSLEIVNKADRVFFENIICLLNELGNITIALQSEKKYIAKNIALSGQIFSNIADDLECINKRLDSL